MRKPHIEEENATPNVEQADPAERTQPFDEMRASNEAAKAEYARRKDKIEAFGETFVESSESPSTLMTQAQSRSYYVRRSSVSPHLKGYLWQ